MTFPPPAITSLEPTKQVFQYVEFLNNKFYQLMIEFSQSYSYIDDNYHGMFYFLNVSIFLTAVKV